jgi:adenine-specific DNA-methyltransferase
MSVPRSESPISANSDFSILEPVDQRRIIKEILDANMLYVNQTDIDDDEMNVSDIEKSFNRSFFG